MGVAGGGRGQWMEAEMVVAGCKDAGIYVLGWDDGDGGSGKVAGPQKLMITT